MKKGIVMEQHQKYTIVMTHDGLFEKAHPVEGAEIGFEVNYMPFTQSERFSWVKEKFFTMRVVAIACIFLVMLVPLYMVANGNKAYAYVDIDINPSMELEINHVLEVSNVIPFNDEAESLLDDLGNLKGKDVEDAIDIIIKKSEEKGFINTAKNVLIGVHYITGDQEEPLIDIIDEHFANNPIEWEVVTVMIPEEVRITAEENKQSMNEALAEKFSEQPDEDIKSLITDEDSKVLQSFYSNNNDQADLATENSPQSDENNSVSEENNDVFKEELDLRIQKGASEESEIFNNGASQQKRKDHNRDKYKDFENHHNGPKDNYSKDKKDWHTGKDGKGQQKNPEKDRGNGPDKDKDREEGNDKDKRNHHRKGTGANNKEKNDNAQNTNGNSNFEKGYWNY